MRLLLASILCLLLWASYLLPAAAAVTDSAVKVKWSTCLNAEVTDFTVATGTTWLLVSYVSTINTAPDAMTWDGAAMTAGPFENAGTMKVWTWYLADPNPGTLTLAVSNGSNYCHLHLVTSDDPDILGTYSEYNNSGGTYGYTTSTAGTLLDFLGVNDDTGGNWAPDSGQTVLQEGLGGTGSGSYTLTISGSTQSSYTMTGVPHARVSYLLGTWSTTTEETTTTTSTVDVSALTGYAQAGVFSLALLTMLATFYAGYRASLT